MRLHDTVVKYAQEEMDKSLPHEMAAEKILSRFQKCKWFDGPLLGAINKPVLRLPNTTPEETVEILCTNKTVQFDDYPIVIVAPWYLFAVMKSYLTGSHQNFTCINK
jgi:hypothetical protein